MGAGTTDFGNITVRISPPDEEMEEDDSMPSDLGEPDSTVIETMSDQGITESWMEMIDKTRPGSSQLISHTTMDFESLHHQNPITAGDPFILDDPDLESYGITISPISRFSDPAPAIQMSHNQFLTESSWTEMLESYNRSEPKVHDITPSQSEDSYSLPTGIAPSNAEYFSSAAPRGDVVVGKVSMVVEQCNRDTLN